jgi:integrase
VNGSTQRRPKGKGSIIKRADSPVLWIKYSHQGKLYRESANTTDERKAEKLLEQRLAELKTNTFVAPSTQRIRIQELADDLLAEYRANERKSIDDANARWNHHLKPAFAHLRANSITTEHITRYIQKRQAAGGKNATINRELALLKRMFRLGYDATPQKILRPLRVKKLAEKNVRTGFIDHAQYRALLHYSQELWYRTLVVLGTTYGWRVNELLRMRVSQVDLLGRTIRLEPGCSKTGAGREVTMTGAVYDLLTECVRGKQPSDFVLTRTCGKPVRDFRGTWYSACVNARLGRLVCRRCQSTNIKESRCRECRSKNLHYEGLIFHDLRRTAARNLRAAGVAEGVIMQIGGWKTRSVFERYAIITTNDIADAMTKLEAHERDKSRIGHTDQFRAGLQATEKSATLRTPTV